MYNIVIADDEQLARMVLRQSLEEYLGDRCAIREAVNGREATETALLMRADLVIMDIEMPGMSGLEAAQIITKKLSHCKIVILTAYSEFDYAREAISFGSAEYLLKPCSDEDLHSALNRILPQIDYQRAGQLERERSMERIQTLSMQIEEQIVRTVMGGYITAPDILKQMKNYGVDFQNGVFAILYRPVPGGENDIVSALKSSSWPQNCRRFSYSYDGRVYMVNISDRADEDSAALIAAHLEVLSQAAKTLWGHPLYGAIGKSYSNIQYMQLSCVQALTALGKCTDDQPINIYDEESDAESSAFSDDPVINSVLFGDVEEISCVASGIVNSLFAQQLEFDVALRQLNYYLAKVVQSLRTQTGFAVPDIIISTAAGTMDMDSLKHDTASRLCHLADHLSAQGENRDMLHLQNVREKIEKYVHRHYHEDLLLPGIAKTMNYSSAYFSKLFKQCFQRNFITYLTDVRIEAAKELLQNTRMTIREVGEKVGYKDSNYFTKVFRKVVGMKPSEYRELYITHSHSVKGS